MPPIIRAVLFDYGLVLTGPPDPAAWTQMLAITSLDEETYHEAYWAPRHAYDLGTLTGESYFQAVGLHAGLTLAPSQVQSLLAADIRLWTQPNQPMIDFAARLQAAGTPTGILSNLGDHLTAGILTQLPWLAAFSHATFSHALRITKPDPEIYAHAARGLRTPPASILFLDDREDNIAGARAAGLQTIRYTTQPSFERTVQTLGLEPLWRTGRP